MPVVGSVQQRKLTSINHKNFQLFCRVSGLSFIHFFRRPVFVWQKFIPVFLPLCIRSFCCSGACQYAVQFRRLTSHFSFVRQFLVCRFFLPSFLGNLHFQTPWKIFTAHFTVDYVKEPLLINLHFKYCWIISLCFCRSIPLQNSHHLPFPLPSPKPLPVLPPPILPSSRPLYTSTKFFVHFRPACTGQLFPPLFQKRFESRTKKASCSMVNVK